MTPPRQKWRLLALVPDPQTPFDQAGGILSASRLLFGGALRDDFEVRIVDTLMRAYPRPGAGARLRGGLLRWARTLRHLVVWRPDLVVAFCSAGPSYYEKSALLMLARLGGARVYLSPRSGFQANWLARGRFARFWVSWTARFIDGFLVQSRYWRDLHSRHGVPERKLHLWYNFVDPALWATVAAQRRACSGGRPFRFLFLAWAVPEKGLRELVQASDILSASSGPSFEVVIAGDGSVARELRERRRRGGLASNILLLNWVAGGGREDELRAADALVLPTWVEGFPNVILEAMACALPVIATPVGAIPEVVEDGVTGLVVPVRSPERLAEAMDRLRRAPDEAVRMGQRGVERVHGRFNVEQGLARFREILGTRVHGQEQSGAASRGVPPAEP